MKVKLCLGTMIVWLAMTFTGMAHATTLPPTASDEVRQALNEAHAGNVDSMYRIATFLVGQSVVEDDETAKFAFGWALLAARNGHAQAAELTGVMYRSGIGVPQNYVKARKWLERALARRSNEPNFELAILYADDDNPGVDKVKAANYLGDAITASEPRACLISARNKVAKGVELRRIVEEITCAADGGLAEAMEMMADYNLAKRSPYAAVRAREWLVKAIDAGSVTAAEKLAALDNQPQANSQ